jgi:hypothetical protein
MRRIAEFRAKWYASSKGSEDRRGQSVRGRIWWVAGTVLTLSVLAAPGPALRFGPAPNFGSPLVGSRSAEHFVSLRNSGLARLTITDIRISGGGAKDFLPGTSDCSNVAIPPGRGCMFGVVFAPRDDGRRVAELVVASDDLVAPARLVLDATAATRVDLRVTPLAISFGDLKLGAGSEEKAVEVSSSLNTPVRILEARITHNASGEFQLGNNTCADLLPKGGACTIGVGFHPRVAGERTGQLELVDDSGDAPHEVTLTGRGAVGELTLQPEQISFAATQIGQRSEPESVEIRNSGNDDVQLGAVGLAGDAARDFVILEKNSCESVTLHAGAACELRAQFEPKATGPRTATISQGDDAPDGPHAIQLVGTGTEAGRPSAQIYAKSYSFGRQALRTASKPVQVWVVSRGKAPLRIGTVDFQGGGPKDFGLKTNCSQRTLAQNDQCEIDVYFSPLTAGDAQARIFVPHDAPDAPTYFSVDGIGIGEERGWCCLESKVFETDENTCRARGGRLFPDPGTAQSQCSHPAVPPKTPQAEAPTGLEPGTPSPSGTRPIACGSVTLRWNPVAAPGGYLVSLARFQKGADAAQRVISYQDVFTNSFRISSSLEAGSYEWSVTSLGQPGQQNAPGRPSYFVCAARINVAERPQVATLSNSKAKATSMISPPIQ